MTILYHYGTRYIWAITDGPNSYKRFRLIWGHDGSKLHTRWGYGLYSELSINNARRNRIETKLRCGYRRVDADSAEYQRLRTQIEQYLMWRALTQQHQS